MQCRGEGERSRGKSYTIVKSSAVRKGGGELGSVLSQALWRSLVILSAPFHVVLLDVIWALNSNVLQGKLSEKCQ